MGDDRSLLNHELLKRMDTKRCIGRPWKYGGTHTWFCTKPVRLMGSTLALPTRMMWGTDLIYSWNFEAAVIHELTRFGRDFIAGLDPEVQERVAYRNAAEMLGLPLN